MVDDLRGKPYFSSEVHNAHFREKHFVESPLRLSVFKSGKVSTFPLPKLEGYVEERDIFVTLWIAYIVSSFCLEEDSNAVFVGSGPAFNLINGKTRTISQIEIECVLVSHVPTSSPKSGIVFKEQIHLGESSGLKSILVYFKNLNAIWRNKQLDDSRTSCRFLRNGHKPKRIIAILIDEFGIYGHIIVRNSQTVADECVCTEYIELEIPFRRRERSFHDVCHWP